MNIYDTPMAIPYWIALILLLWHYRTLAKVLTKAWSMIVGVLIFYFLAFIVNATAIWFNDFNDPQRANTVLQQFRSLGEPNGFLLTYLLATYIWFWIIAGTGAGLHGCMRLLVKALGLSNAEKKKNQPDYLMVYAPGYLAAGYRVSKGAVREELYRIEAVNPETELPDIQRLEYRR